MIRVNLGKAGEMLVPTGQDYGKLTKDQRATVAHVLTGRDATYDDRGRIEAVES